MNYKVNENFSCSNNNLTSLEGCPEIVNGHFDCSNNQLISLEHCPKIVNGNFYCRYNKKKFTVREVKKYCKVKGNIYVQI